MTMTNETDGAAPAESTPKPRTLRRRVLSRVSIQSKLLAMLLVTSVLSAAVVGFIGYQSGRSSLRADEAEDEFETPERLNGSLEIIAPTLRLNRADMEAMLPHARLARYGANEYLQFAGEVPKWMMFIVNGRARLEATGENGAVIPVRILEEGDFLGQTALTREPVTASACALTEVTVLQFGRDQIEELVARKPVLLQDIDRAIEDRRAGVRRAISAAAD
jgi:hypothetical protein